MKRSAIRSFGICGLLGVLVLILSFVINPGPGPHPTLDELIRFKEAHYTSSIVGAWMQAISPPLIVTFAVGLIFLSGNHNRPAGWLAFMGGLILLIVSMIEVTFYFSALTGDPATTAMISMDLISAVQRLYSIIAAPFFFFTLSFVLIRSTVLPVIMAYIGLVLGSCFFILGIFQLLYPIQNIVDVLAMIQGFWWLAASVLLIARAARITVPG